MTVIAVVVVIAGGWLLLVKPQGAKISAVKAQAATQQSANQVLLQEIAARMAQKDTLPAEQAQLQKLSVQVPTAPDEPGIIRQLQSSAAGAGVNLVSITPAGATAVTATASTATTLPSTAPTAQLVELPLSMSVVGTYANVESYLQLLEKLPRAMLVTQFSLCPMVSGGSGGSCTAVTVPSNTNVPAQALGVTLSADVFFSPTTPIAAAGSTTTLPGTTAPATTPASPATSSTTAPTATTSPATTPASPAATSTTAPTATTPAN
jgi:Tfp pilus assembly protein PilO